MRIELQQAYKSIATLTTEDLPDFAVLIGRNGAGKTQILEALKEGHAVVSGVGLKDIELYDMTSFQAPKRQSWQPRLQSVWQDYCGCISAGGAGQTTTYRGRC